MGKSRRRQTAKTGDKGIYKKRDDASDKKKNDDDDPMYDKVDQFHNEQDFLKLDRDEHSESEDEIDRQEAVMNLGVGGESSDDDDDDSSSDEENVPKRKQSSHTPPSDDDDDDEDEEGVSSDDEEDEEMPMSNVRDWGRQKKDYYDGDTADLEIGQEEDDALVEEEAAKEIQAARYEQMKEEDFVLSDDEVEEDSEEKAEGALEASATRDFKSRSEKIKFLDRKHPELLPLVSHFTDMLREWKDQTNVVTRALLEGEKGTPQAVGATKLGQQYLLNKAMLQSSAGLNLCAYLLLKSEQADAGNDLEPAWIQNHPVMKHLNKINALAHKLEDKIEKKVPGLEGQLDKLVKASALLTGGEVEFEKDDDEEDDAEDASETGDIELDTQDKDVKIDAKDERDGSSEDSSDEDDNDNEDDSALDEQARARSVANEARFGLRTTEVVTAQTARRRQQAPASDFGDADEGTTDAGKALAATLNSIEQRSAARKRKVSPMADTIDEPNEDEEMRRGLAMMEEDLGPASDDDGGMDDNAGNDEEDAFDPEVEGNDDFYTKMSKKSKSKKAFKKNLYAVKPKYPRMEEEIEGERSLSKAIMKNRGLVAHKNKLNRNPRVKKREQYRKALIRRKGAVREVRTEEGHKYGGESTGIKSNISRSHRFAS